MRRYKDGSLYRPVRGRRAPREAVESWREGGPLVVDLRQEQPDWRTFWSRVERELRIRFYRPKSVKNYRIALRFLARWFRRPPHELTSEDVRNYLLGLVEKGGSASWVALNISVIRTCIDKLGGLSVSEGLHTPRAPKHLPAVLSEQEVQILLSAAPSRRDKALLGLMYACGLRVSEVCRLRWADIDVDRKTLRVWRGKGMKDRYIMLPARVRGVTFRRAPPSRSWPGPCASRESPNGPRARARGTALPHTSSSTGSTRASSRSSWVTCGSIPRESTPTSRPSREQAGKPPRPFALPAQWRAPRLAIPARPSRPPENSDGKHEHGRRLASVRLQHLS